MKKQIDGQLNLFDYMSEEEKNFSSHLNWDTSLSVEKNLIYEECTKCWCSTCRHNGKGKAIPRDFAGIKKPCPSCEFCINQHKAEICEIGSYENGCKLRAEEEGLT